jgi:hypothetical protein
MLQRGDAVPHFEVRTVEDEPFSYSSIWQRKNLLLVSLPTIDADSARGYITDLTTCLRQLGDQNLEHVITRDGIPGVSGSTVLVADRWGEIVHAVEVADLAQLPSSQELLEWVNYVNNQCPECEGEAR